MVLADEQYTNTLHFDETDHRESLMPKEPLDDKKNYPLFLLDSVKDRELVKEEPIHNDVYSYNTKRTYDRVETYREHMDLFSKRNGKNLQSVIFDTLPPEDKLSSPGNVLENQLTNGNDNHKYTIAKFNENNNENKKQELIPLTDKQNLGNKKVELESPSKINRDEIITFKESDIDDKLSINATKDYHPEDRKESDVYVSSHTIPTNALKSNNDLVRTTVVHIDIMTYTYDPQQPQHQYNQKANNSPGNSVHISIDTSIPNSDVQIKNQPTGNPEVHKSILQLPNNQNVQEFDRQVISANVPIRANKPNLITNAVQDYPLLNSYSPTSVLIYVNGQLILIPGVVLNPQSFPVPIQNGAQGEINISVQSPSNAVFTNQPNQNSILRFNNLASSSNDDSKSDHSENLHPGSDHRTNNNLRFYYKPDGYEKPIPYKQL